MSPTAFIKHLPRYTLGLALLLPVGAAAHAGEATPTDNTQGIAFFEAKIRPVLVEHCYKCHSAKTARSEGGLMLDSKKALRAGGDRGPAVVPGDPAKSWLLTAIAHTDADLKMPPKKDQLSAAVINDFKTWIRT